MFLRCCCKLDSWMKARPHSGIWHLYGRSPVQVLMIIALVRTLYCTSFNDNGTCTSIMNDVRQLSLQILIIVLLVRPLSCTCINDSTLNCWTCTAALIYKVILFSIFLFVTVVYVIVWWSVRFGLFIESAVATTSYLNYSPVFLNTL